MSRLPDPNLLRRQATVDACAAAFRDHADLVPVDVWSALYTGACVVRLTAGEFFAFVAAVAAVHDMARQSRRAVTV